MRCKHRLKLYSGRLLDLMVNEMPQAFILKKAIVSLGMKITLQGTITWDPPNGKRNIIFTIPFLEDMLVPWRVVFFSGVAAWKNHGNQKVSLDWNRPSDKRIQHSCNLKVFGMTSCWAVSTSTMLVDWWRGRLTFANFRHGYIFSICCFNGFIISMLRSHTTPKFNIAPQKWWLEDYFPIGKVAFQGLC